MFLRCRLLGKRHKLLSVSSRKLFTKPQRAVVHLVSRRHLFRGERDVLHAVPCRQYLICGRVLVLQRLLG